MVTEALIGLVGWVVEQILGVLPTIPVPSWASSSSGALATVFQAAGAIGGWVPLGLLGTVLGALLAIHLAAFGIKIARIIASFLTAGGGSAA